MKNYTYAWEVQTLLEQFIGAFNDITIKRYDNQKSVIPSLSAVKVIYVYAPKSRVFATLNNPAPGGLTLPAVSVSIASISRDNSRVFNKNDGFEIPYNNETNVYEYDKKIPQPVPINISVNMTIITKYQVDMDQIISNFVPYNDPYIVISWKMPHVDAKFPTEIRSEILWSGNIAMNYPIDLAGNQSYRVTADTSFIIKGWLFKKMEDVVSKIYVIDSDYNSTNFNNGLLVDLDTLTTEYLSVSARPNF